jgi:pimeloyl-ACP methyl ester carboxylesterase
MGAKVVLQLALDHPALVRAAVAMGVSGRPAGFLEEWLQAEVEFRRQGGPHSTGFSGKQIISPCEGNASPGFPWVSRRAPLTDRHGHKKITSTTSMPYNFTTKSGGVWKFLMLPEFVVTVSGRP